MQKNYKNKFEKYLKKKFGQQILKKKGGGVKQIWSLFRDRHTHTHTHFTIIYRSSTSSSWLILSPWWPWWTSRCSGWLNKHQAPMGATGPQWRKYRLLRDVLEWHLHTDGMIMMIFFWYAHTYSTIMTYTMRMVMVMAATYHHHGERYLLYLFNE